MWLKKRALIKLRVEVGLALVLVSGTSRKWMRFLMAGSVEKER